MDPKTAIPTDSPARDPLVEGFDTIELNPILAQSRKEERLQRLNTRWIPTLRWIGFGLAAVIVFVYNHLADQSEFNRALPGFVLGTALYCAISGVTLRRFYRPYARVDIGLVFLTLDLLILLWAIHISGAESSWLVMLLLFRTADQSNTSFRRALAFAHLTPLAYLALMVYLAVVEQRPIDWTFQLGKATLLYCGNIYLALSVQGSDRSRRKTAAAVSMARTLIQRFDAQASDLETAWVEAAAASRAKGEFLANMSHEIRTPIGAILGLTELLAKSELPETTRKHVGLLQASAEGLLQLIDDVLDFSKVEAGKLELHKEPFNLRGAMGSLVEILEPRAHSQRLTLELTLDDRLPRHLLGDLPRLRQVLLNLLGNAIKFTDKGSVSLDVRASESALPAHAEDAIVVRFAVQDTGIGIAPEALETLFDPFVQADGSSSRRHGGTGLGLAISKQLVELMGGSIGCSSKPGEGSTFWCVIPMNIAAGVDDPTLQTGAYRNPLHSVQGCHILVAEDDPVNQVVVSHQLESLGHSAKVVENGYEALEALTLEPYDLVLMDCQMPSLDGYETTRRIRKLPGRLGQIPVVALTAHALEGDRHKCLAAGMDDYLPKPFREAELQEMLERWLQD